MVKTAKLSDFTGCREIAAGGEGKIFEHPSDKNKVVKIYHKLRDKKFADHLVLLSTLGPMFIKPIDIYIDNQLKVIGFDMQYVDFNKYWLFNNLFNKGFCNSNNITEDFKIRVLTKLKMALEHIHQNNITVGDLNQYNLFVGRNGDIIFVDVDSYATPKSQHNGVLLDDIRDWTTANINDKTDIWAYDILAFWATTYCHPFKWMVPGNTESLEQRVKTGKSILSKIAGIKIPPLYNPPQGDTLKQFMEIFTGRRYMVNFSGTHIPVSVVVKQNIQSNSLTVRELYKNVKSVNACNEYITIQLNDSIWKMIETKMRGITRETVVITCDDLFPSDSGNYAYIKDNHLLTGRPFMGKKFAQPVYQYTNGSLIVIDYATDMQWMFNINNQLAGMDSTQTTVFAKSVLKRSSLIQNFGSQKYINVPVLNTSSLIFITNDLKDAYYCKGYIAAEYKTKNQVNFSIIKPTSIINDYKFLDFDYLPYFTVTNTGMIIVPDNGFLNVYDKDFHLVATFDCSFSTRDSKLYQTNAGIVMLEDNTLYLLNTK